MGWRTFLNTVILHSPEDCLQIDSLTSDTESGFLVFKFHEAQLAGPNVHVEVVMDDYMFPAYTSHKLRSKSVKIEDSMSLLCPGKNEH